MTNFPKFKAKAPRKRYVVPKPKFVGEKTDKIGSSAKKLRRKFKSKIRGNDPPGPKSAAVTASKGLHRGKVHKGPVRKGRGGKRKRGSGVKVTKTRNWVTARQFVDTLPIDVQMAIDDVVQGEAERFVTLARVALKTGGLSNNRRWRPNKKTTLAFKRGSKPLSDTGALSDSLFLRKEGAGEYRLLFKGVGGRSAAEMTKIAMVHEKGAVITQKTTRKQQFAIRAKMSAAPGLRSRKRSGNKKSGYIVIKIPKRSFLVSTKQSHFKSRQLRKRVRTKMRQNLLKYRSMFAG